MRFKKLIGLAISASVLFTSIISGGTSFGDDYKGFDDIPKDIKELYDFSTAEYISDLENDDPCSLIVKNKNGSYTMLQFNEPIKYYDKDCDQYKFIDNNIIKSYETGYSFENSANSFSCKFSENCSDGVLFKDDKYSVKIMPVSVDFSSAKLVSNRNKETKTVVYENAFGSGIDLQYLSTSNGVKENVIIESSSDFSSYSFHIELNGLKIVDNKCNKFSLYDIETDKEILDFAPVFIVDSTHENVSYDNYYTIDKTSENSYNVTVNLDERFLLDKNTIYPCVVDPTISYSGTSNFSGCYASQSGSTLSNSYYQVGSFNGIGECISYLKLTSLDKAKWINPENIIYANLNFQDCSINCNSGTITCFDSNNILNVSNVTYSQLTSAIGDSISSVSVSNSNCIYSFNITSLFKKWILNQIGQGGFSANYGCIFKGNTSLINRKAYKTDNGNNRGAYLEISFNYDEPIENGIYKISSLYNQTYIQNNGASQNATSSSTTLLNNGKWKIKKVGLGKYTIQPYNNSSLYLGVSSSVVNVNIKVDSAYASWYIVQNSDESFRIMPAFSLNESNAIAYSSGTVKLNEYSNTNHKNWNIKALYQYDIVHHYDYGYNARFPYAASNIDSYQGVVSAIYSEIFGLKINSTINSYISCADNCSGLPMTYYKTLSGCYHSINHKTRINMIDDLNNQFGDGNSTLSVVSWTGHILDNKSACSLRNSILINTGPVIDSSNNNLSNDIIRRQRIYTLLHETSHQLGASDHYCYDTDHTPCGNEECFSCVYGLDDLPYCVMSYRLINLEEKLNAEDLNDIYCTQCKSSTHNRGILTHLNAHHTN